ncbi:MAG: chemotaxis protein CheD [Lachnospiraceae bacterium]|nr:chemotaxis protein CheD [Lachnospiraceae bacterium]MDN4744034.1 chemotaxis protein CheD [Lachnospiraceae bacterium C1.1]
MGDLIKVGMADLQLCPKDKGITTLGLGSCVGVAIVDKATRQGGLAHVMLPDSTAIRNNSNVAKFADTGVAELVRQMEAAGAKRARMVAKIAGGAQMFAFQNNSALVKVGERNVQAVKAKLKELGIPILAEDTGLNFGRTVEFFPATGDYVIKAVGKPVKTI